MTGEGHHLHATSFCLSTTVQLLSVLGIAFQYWQACWSQDCDTGVSVPRPLNMNAGDLILLDTVSQSSGGVWP
jgi:hypothetical protein